MIYALSDLTDENDITPDWGRYLLQNVDRYIYKNPDVMIYGTSGDPTHISKDMVEKGLERESDDVIVGVKAEGLKRFIVRIVMFKIIYEPEIRWTGKVGT